MQLTQWLQEINVLEKITGNIKKDAYWKENQYHKLNYVFWESHVLKMIASTSVVSSNKSCKHNVVHPVLVKRFDNKLKNETSIFHTCSIVAFFFALK